MRWHRGQMSYPCQGCQYPRNGTRGAMLQRAGPAYLKTPSYGNFSLVDSPGRLYPTRSPARRAFPDVMFPTLFREPPPELADRAVKQDTIHKALRCRRDHGDVFRNGE